MVPTEEAMITRQILYSALLVSTTCTAFAISCPLCWLNFLVSSLCFLNRWNDRFETIVEIFSSSALPICRITARPTTWFARYHTPVHRIAETYIYRVLRLNRPRDPI